MKPIITAGTNFLKHVFSESVLDIAKILVAEADGDTQLLIDYLERVRKAINGWITELRDNPEATPREFEKIFTHHEADESLQEAVTHQMEDDQVVDDYVRKGLDEVCLKYAELGADWQKEQAHGKATAIITKQ